MSKNVDVLVVMDGLSSLWRDESKIVGRWDSADELDSIRAAVAQLIAGYDQIKHSIQQARIPGNDWRRELVLIENTADAAIARVKGVE